MTDVGERPARLDPHVDVDAAPARGLREAPVSELAQQLPRLPRDLDGIVEVGARLGVEVDPKLVGVVDVGAANGPRVEGERAHVRAPRHDAELGGADLIRVAPGGELDPRGLDPVRGALRDPLLVEGVAHMALSRRDGHPLVDSLRPALERGRPLPERAHDPVPDRHVVLGDLELGDVARSLRRREDHPVGARDPHLAPIRLDHGRVRRHGSGGCRIGAVWAQSSLFRKRSAAFLAVRHRPPQSGSGRAPRLPTRPLRGSLPTDGQPPSTTARPPSTATSPMPTTASAGCSATRAATRARTPSRRR